MNSNFMENLKRIRKENDLSQEQLADKLNVSRQSVSKWESGLAYPEMDKVLQLCKLFNLNIDELLNQDLEEVKEKKESKNKVNKYIDEFLNYLTRTIDMFSNMKFKSKIKCIFEQITIIFVLWIFGCILKSIGGNLYYAVFNFLNSGLYNFGIGLIGAVFEIAYLLFSFIVLVHAFKTRYLDYYEKILNKEEKTVVENKDNIKNFETAKKEKIIIRDPKHSDYKFINGLLKCCLLFVKFIVACILLGFVFSFILCVIFLILCLYHISVHSLFIGVSLLTMSGLIINYITIDGLFSFIFNKKFKIKKVFIEFIISLLVCGVGCGLTFISCLNLKYETKDYENKDKITKVYNYNKDFNININNQNYTFAVDNKLTNKVKVDIKYSDDLYDLIIDTNNNDVFIHYVYNFDSWSTVYKEMKKSLKNNTLINYNSEDPEILIISSEKNIKKMIDKLSSNTVSTLKEYGGKYYLYLDSDYGNVLCSKENSYYNDCVYLSVDGDIDLNDFKYENKELKYDNGKYSCEKYNKEFYCNLNEE